MNLKLLKEILREDVPSKKIKENENQIFEMIPELSYCKNFNQNNIWHVYDVYEHILHVVDNVPNNINLRIAALFHDLGKPFVYNEDEDGIGHFYGHWEKSKDIFELFATKYQINEENKKLISNLILYHDISIDKLSEEKLNQLINILGIDGMIMLFELKKSDLLAQNPKFHYILNNYEKQKQKILSDNKKTDRY